MSELAPPLGISPADWDATPPSVRAVVLALLDQVQTLHARVTELEHQRQRHSGNSSRPPSSDPPSAPPRAPRALKPAQFNALLRQSQHTRNPQRNTAIVQMLVQTGMRIGECAALRWTDLSYGEKRGQVRIRVGKGNKARMVPLNESVRRALADYLAPVLQVEPTLKAVAAVWSRAPRQSVWTSARGDQLSVREMSRMVQELVRACAVRDLVPADTTPHSLRHTFATRYLATHPDDLVGLARLLGHSSLEATKIYVQPSDEELAARVDRIDLNAYGR